MRGNAGRALVPVKRGETDRDFAVVGVSVPDRPGQIAGVLVSAAQAGINVEDVRVEHLPGRPSGVIEVVVAANGPRARHAPPSPPLAGTSSPDRPFGPRH